ncbi:MAG: glycosyl hydrolase, partial [Bacteroidia bacterium]|nr:glycosyl hydrolase [Bacteroidia bacterium]
MKNKHLFLPLVLILAIALVLIQNNSQENNDVEKLRELHKTALENSPYKDSKNLTKEERKKFGFPPNPYHEMMWEYTMDPQLGRPAPERVEKLQQRLNQESPQARGVGGDASNPWIDRGPNNIGGRTRAVLFDPNDGTNSRVFSGGVSGGLWVNNDITDANSSWTLVPGIGANISVNVIIADPNNSNTFYIGTGESYSSGAVIGRGIWKSTDAGVTWTNIFGGATGTVSSGNQLIDGVFYINDLVARNNGGATELYASVAGAFYSYSAGPSQFHGIVEQGLYKSTDGGANWTKSASPAFQESNGSPSNLNDIELDINNNIWVTTTFSSWGFNGGKIIQSTDGNSWSVINAIPNADRTELEPSATNANVFWVLKQDSSSGQVDIYTTTDAFATFTQITTEPNDADPNIPANDFTRGQAFWDLVIESDASGNLIVGGINIFRSTNGGANWSQISEWYNIAG